MFLDSHLFLSYGVRASGSSVLWRIYKCTSSHLHPSFLPATDLSKQTRHFYRRRKCIDTVGYASVLYIRTCIHVYIHGTNTRWICTCTHTFVQYFRQRVIQWTHHSKLWNTTNVCWLLLKWSKTLKPGKHIQPLSQYCAIYIYAQTVIWSLTAHSHCTHNPIQWSYH